MEQLAERRMQREEDTQYGMAAAQQALHRHSHGPLDDDEDYDDEEDEGDEEEEDEEEEEEEDEEYDSQEEDDYEEDEMVSFERVLGVPFYFPSVLTAVSRTP